MTYKHFYSLILFFVFLGNAYGKQNQRLLKNIYTDDSRYYLQLSQNGFNQRIKVSRKYCHLVKGLSIKLKFPDLNKKKTKSQKESQKLSNWPSLYSQSAKDNCWFETSIKGLNLNSPEKNLYLLTVHLESGKTFNIGGIRESILIENRISSRKTKNWISLGQQGATLVKGGGVFYKLWEPLADKVHLFINNESKPFILTSDQQKSPLTSHVIFLKESKVNDKYLYKFIKNGQYEILQTANNDIFSDVKIDPMARGLSYEKKGGKYNGYINPQAIVTAHSKYKFKHDQKIHSLPIKDRDNWIIYQIWPLTFNPKKKNGKYIQGTFNDIKEKIPYLSDLGITSVELLPIHESRFHASWGYAMDSILLLEKHYGTPQDLKKLVDSFHNKKIRVILDVVLNHINNHLIRDPLSEEVSVSKFYKGNTGWGPKPRFEYSPVRKWILDSLLILMRDYHIDGFRFDMVEHIYIDNPAGYKFLQELNTLLKRENKHFYSTAEQLPDNAWATFPISQNGLAFDGQWNDKFKNFFELEFDHYRSYNKSINIYPLAGSLKGYSNHRINNNEQHFGGPLRTVNYLGSHDVVGNKNPLLRVVSNYESYEWEGLNHFFRVKPSESSDNMHAEFRQIHNFFTHSLGRASYGTLFTKPGASLFFQGEELASDINIENEWSYINAQEANTIPTQNVDLHRYIKSHKVQWEFLDPKSNRTLSFLSEDEINLFKGYHQFFKKMVHFKKNHPEFNFSDAKNVNTHFNAQALSWTLGEGAKEYFIILNLGEQQTKDWVKFPGYNKDWWQEIYNSSQKEYGNNNDSFQNIISNVGGRANNIRIDGPSILIFKKIKAGIIHKSLYLRGSINNWTASPKNRLSKASDHGDIYVVNLEVKRKGLFEFKLGTKDWGIDIGSSFDAFSLFTPKELTKGKGYLSYIPGLPNIRTSLDKGSYKFIFNIRNYKYNFIKTKEGGFNEPK